MPDMPNDIQDKHRPVSTSKIKAQGGSAGSVICMEFPMPVVQTKVPYSP